MGRGKVEMKMIENKTSRQVSFCKRKKGLMKKANELSVLCNVEIALIIFSGKGKCTQYCTPSLSMQQMIRKYLNATGSSFPQGHDVMSQLVHMREQVLDLQLSLKRYQGEDLSSVQFDELNALEKQLEISCEKVRARKVELMQQQVENLKRTEKMMEKQNDEMCQWLSSQETYKQEVIDQMEQQQQAAMTTELKLMENHDHHPNFMEHFPPPSVYFSGGQPSSSNFLSLLQPNNNHQDSSDHPDCSYL